jgi:hypothetical protein
MSQPTHRSGRPTRGSVLTLANPLYWVVRWADWFEARGVYVPGEDSRSLSPWRDFGWLFAAWMVSVAALIVLFAVAT